MMPLCPNRWTVQPQDADPTHSGYLPRPGVGSVLCAKRILKLEAKTIAYFRSAL